MKIQLDYSEICILLEAAEQACGENFTIEEWSVLTEAQDKLLAAKGTLEAYDRGRLAVIQPEMFA